MENKKKYLIAGIILFILLIAFVLIIQSKSNNNQNKSSNNQNSQDDKSSQNSQDNQINKEREKDEESEKDIYTIKGEVIQTEGNKIKIRALSTILGYKTIVVDKNTMIYKLIAKNQKDFEIEIEEFKSFLKKMEYEKILVTEPIIPPEFFIKEQANLSNIQVGQKITATAQGNIKNIEEFTAVKIEFVE